ncbi:hypothetical protein CBL_13652 [Carabus blaptoides fortunei]
MEKNSILFFLKVMGDKKNWLWRRNDEAYSMYVCDFVFGDKKKNNGTAFIKITTFLNGRLEQNCMVSFLSSHYTLPTRPTDYDKVSIINERACSGNRPQRVEIWKAQKHLVTSGLGAELGIGTPNVNTAVQPVVTMTGFVNILASIYSYHCSFFRLVSRDTCGPCVPAYCALSTKSH